MQFLRGFRDYCQGVQVHLPENSSDNVVFLFFSPQLILQFYRGCPMVISKKTIIFKGFRGGPTFSREGGGNFFHGGGGVQLVISIETLITCDFPGGGGGPHIPPLDPHMRFHNLFFLFQKETLAVASQKIPLKKTIYSSTKTNVWTYR